MQAAGNPAAASQRPWKRAFLWLVFLGPFFFASYGLANWVASRRAEVGAVVFDWERSIPFAAWTIVPYWSIDFLYGLSLFVCTTHRELDVHGRRLLCAQLISVSCFLLFPLRFTFPRPETDGFFGLMFDVLTGFDKPFNQAPSLHIALLVILWVLYLRHVQGRWRWVVNAWFVLIGISVLTTYQHHFIDLPTGLWAGWLCVWLFPEDGRSHFGGVTMTADPRRGILAVRYGAAALVVGAIAIHVGGWATWLLWVSGSLAVVSVIHAFLDETAFQKRADGSMSAAAWWLLAPYILGAWLNSRWWTRATASADAVVPGLLLGRLPTRNERDAQGVRAIVDVTAELPCAAGGVRYVNVPQFDLVAPSIAQIERSVIAIETVFSDGPVLVCCALGFSRSATAVAAWLVASGRAASDTDAVEQVRRARPAVVLDAAHMTALGRFAEQTGKSFA
ncbi:MAG: serine/threonine protein phosphatase [Betaproteobacteria bacterium RIFCSPLOWO2_12_FULL_62_13]|nr:MAG: serine/threonine protein phosphatase [Betaproteobacteria bacterium RIFCSPLOWO2_12_FULL_62_13]